jgi:hypothetical protein
VDVVGPETRRLSVMASRVAREPLPDQDLSCFYQWIGLRENLQETMVFTIKYRAFL